MTRGMMADGRSAERANQKIPRVDWPGIYERRQEGETFKRIAATYGVSIERIRQIVHYEEKRRG